LIMRAIKKHFVAAPALSCDSVHDFTELQLQRFGQDGCSTFCKV
jgi:hypothetical protein